MTEKEFDCLQQHYRTASALHKDVEELAKVIRGLVPRLKDGRMVRVQLNVSLEGKSKGYNPKFDYGCYGTITPETANRALLGSLKAALETAKRNFRQFPSVEK